MPEGNLSNTCIFLCKPHHSLLIMSALLNSVHSFTLHWGYGIPINVCFLSTLKFFPLPKVISLQVPCFHSCSTLTSSFSWFSCLPPTTFFPCSYSWALWSPRILYPLKQFSLLLSLHLILSYSHCTNSSVSYQDLLDPFIFLPYVIILIFYFISYNQSL